jgi:trehalose 6-phosphate phosphatase
LISYNRNQLKHLSRNLNKISDKLQLADKLVVFLDYDGTLAPISRDPEKAILPKDTSAVLRRLRNNKNIVVAIVSGRLLSQVKKMVSIKGIYYAGCHGLEIENKGYACHPSRLKSVIELLKRIKPMLEKELKSSRLARYAEVEDKGLILALHYRKSDKHNQRRIKKIFHEIARPYAASGDIAVSNNKKVLEIGPNVRWDKGRYCRYFLNSLNIKAKNILPVYIGDDKTDDSAFKVLRKTGLTIFVRGERRTSLAEYYLDSTNEVKGFLEYLARF